MECENTNDKEVNQSSNHPPHALTTSEYDEVTAVREKKITIRLKNVSTYLSILF